MSASASFEKIGTTATVVVAQAAALERARALLEAELDRLDEACSRFRDDSELTYANTRAGELVRIGPLLADAVRVALDAAAATGGAVTPTLGANLRAAGYDRTFRLVRARDGWAFTPSPAVAGAWRDVRLDLQRGELLVPEGVELDLGATAKAFGADRAAAAIAGRDPCGHARVARRRHRRRGHGPARRLGGPDRRRPHRAARLDPGL